MSRGILLEWKRTCILFLSNRYSLFTTCWTEVVSINSALTSTYRQDQQTVKLSSPPKREGATAKVCCDEIRPWTPFKVQQHIHPYIFATSRRIQLSSRVCHLAISNTSEVHRDDSTKSRASPSFFRAWKLQILNFVCAAFPHIEHTTTQTQHRAPPSTSPQYPPRLPSYNSSPLSHRTRNSSSSSSSSQVNFEISYTNSSSSNTMDTSGSPHDRARRVRRRMSEAFWRWTSRSAKK